jgi:hypothetical protein
VSRRSAAGAGDLDGLVLAEPDGLVLVALGVAAAAVRSGSDWTARRAVERRIGASPAW